MEDPLQSLEVPRRPANFDVHDADPFDYLEMIWNEDTKDERYWNEELDIKEEGYWNEEDDDKDICIGAGYVSPPPATTSDEDSNSESEDELSTDDGSTSEEDDVAAHRSRVLDLILEWMAWIYATKIEEELTYLRNCNGDILWNHSRLLVFRHLCYEEIMDTRQQILEGSIVIPISKEKSHTHE